MKYSVFCVFLSMGLYAEEIPAQLRDELNKAEISMHRAVATYSQIKQMLDKAMEEAQKAAQAFRDKRAEVEKVCLDQGKQLDTSDSGNPKCVSTEKQ